MLDLPWQIGNSPYSSAWFEHTRYFSAPLPDFYTAMHRRRDSPIYSPLGCSATLLLGLILGVTLVFSGGGPFSPGPLTASANRAEPLAGYQSHADFEGDCGQCHSPWRGVSSDRCQVCHADVAQQQAADIGLHGRLPNTSQCQHCHTDHKGREANITDFVLSDFEHEQLTGFSLVLHQENFDGAALACQDCHLEGRYDAAAVDCADCHTAGDPTFMASHTTFFGNDCLACHNGMDTMVAFDHNQVFVLDGAHSDLACEVCHQQPVVEGTPNTCVGCHQEPAVHAGLFGTDCSRCHATVAWQPAQLTRHNFPLDHGGEGKIDCQVCHTQSYAAYTCTNCHAHDPAETRREHLEEGIMDVANCADCHPTGLEEEMEAD